MDKKTFTMIATIFLGLGAGFLLNSVAGENMDSMVKKAEYALPGGEKITQDPHVEAFEAPDNLTDNVEYEDLKSRNTAREAIGPWRGFRWSYTPENLMNPALGDSVLLRNTEGRANIFQFAELPDREMNLVMRARSPAQAMGFETDSCSRTRGFVNIEGWGGDIPVEGQPTSEYILHEDKRRNATFGQSVEQFVVDVPDRFEGKKVVFYGGIAKGPICEGMAAELLEIDELYIEAE